MIRLSLRPSPEWEWTSVTVEGEEEEQVAGVLVARMIGADWEVIVGNEDV